MRLDLFDGVEAKAQRGLFNEQLSDKVFGLGVYRWLRVLDFVTLLDVVVRLQIRSAFEGSDPTEELVEDHAEGPVVASVANDLVRQCLRRQVLLSAHQ